MLLSRAGVPCGAIPTHSENSWPQAMPQAAGVGMESFWGSAVGTKVSPRARQGQWGWVRSRGTPLWCCRTPWVGVGLQGGLEPRTWSPWEADAVVSPVDPAGEDNLASNQFFKCAQLKDCL